MLKTTFNKLPPKKVVYRSFHNFSEQLFIDELTAELEYLPAGDFTSLHNKLVDVLDNHAPFKTQVTRASNKPHRTAQ